MIYKFDKFTSMQNENHIPLDTYKGKNVFHATELDEHDHKGYTPNPSPFGKYSQTKSVKDFLESQGGTVYFGSNDDTRIEEVSLVDGQVVGHDVLSGS